MLPNVESKHHDVDALNVIVKLEKDPPEHVICFSISSQTRGFSLLKALYS